jgi:hypothetical protein
METIVCQSGGLRAPACRGSSCRPSVTFTSRGLRRVISRTGTFLHGECPSGPEGVSRFARRKRLGDRMKRRIGDRRGKPRFEIVGDLWGNVEMSTILTIKNLGRGGALLESPRPLAPDSVHWVTAVTGAEAQAVQMRVRHSTPTGFPGQTRYRIGVEFLELSAEMEQLILQQVASGSGPVGAEK